MEILNTVEMLTAIKSDTNKKTFNNSLIDYSYINGNIVDINNNQIPISSLIESWFVYTVKTETTFLLAHTALKAGKFISYQSSNGASKIYYPTSSPNQWIFHVRNIINDTWYIFD